MLAPLACADANHIFDRQHENLPIPEFPCLGRLHNGTNSHVNHLSRQHNFDLRLGQKIDFVFAAAIGFCMAFLSAKAFYYCNGNTLYTDIRKSFANSERLSESNRNQQKWQQRQRQRQKHP